MFVNLLRSPTRGTPGSARVSSVGADAAPPTASADAAEPRLASRLTAEIKLCQKQAAAAFNEVSVLCDSLPTASSRLEGFFQLRSNLHTLIRKLDDVERFHVAMHRPDHPYSPKVLLFTEISLLLLFPYFHRLLTTAEREPTALPWTPGELPDHDPRLALHFKRIDGMYNVKYTGITLASILSAVERNRAWSCYPSHLPSTKQAELAKSLATKLFGMVVCIDMIVDPVVLDDHDLILETAVGFSSHLLVPGVQSTAVLYSRASAERNLLAFTSKVLIANTVVGAGFYRENKLAMAACWSFAGCWYAQPCNRVEAEHQGDLCYTGTREEIHRKLLFAQFVWNLPETALVRNFYKMGLPRIAVDYEFYLPPDPSMEGGADPVHARIICDRKLKQLPDTTSPARALAAVSSSVLRAPLLLHRAPSGNSSGELSDVLICHFHGGGFISMSSFSHENYTRHWARDVGCPIVSVDYRLAPEHKFPMAFNDAYRAYKWCVQSATDKLGFTPRKIVVCGDSAGGNLALSVCVQAITDGIRAPDGMLLCYPVVDMRRRFWPSLLWSVNDRLVPFIFLECAMAAYLDPDPVKATQMALDPRCSPALASDAILRKLPKTRIVCGDRDPLYDQSVRFAHQVARLGVDCKLKIYEGMVHGFLSFLWPVVGVPEVRPCVDDCSSLLRELLA